MAVSYSRAVSVPAGVLIKEVGGEAAIVNLDNSKYFGLDEVGTDFWNALTASESIQQAYDTLLAEYDVEPEILTEELSRLLDELLKHGLLELTDPPRS